MRTKTKHSENDAATLVRITENVAKNDITKLESKFISDALGNCLNEC